MKLIDRTGHRYGRLIVLSIAGRDTNGRTTWLCLCDCGIEKIVQSHHLGQGNVVSCGCKRLDHIKENAKEFGQMAKGIYKKKL